MTGDVSIYEHQGFGRRMGFGHHSALLIIDFVNGFNDPDLFGGGNIGEAIARTVDLLSAARHHQLPIVFTRHVYAADQSDHGLFNLKSPPMKALTPDSHATQVVDELAPRPGEYVISKRYPSAFFCTDLPGWLAQRGVDTAIVSGCTTSGCIRATAVDAMGYGFRPMVVRDCVGDRAEGPHEANLFDLEQKYADVMLRDEVLETLNALNPGQSTAREEV